MAYETKPDTGALFKNTRKTTDTHPDRTGSALIGGVEYFIDGWLNTGKNGEQYLSLKFKPKAAGTARPATRPATAHADMDF